MGGLTGCREVTRSAKCWVTMGECGRGAGAAALREPIFGDAGAHLRDGGDEGPRRLPRYRARRGHTGRLPHSDAPLSIGPHLLLNIRRTVEKERAGRCRRGGLVVSYSTSDPSKRSVEDIR